MKKIFLSSICFLTACTLTPKYDTEFVNPIFNKPLHAYGRNSWNTLLTPNSITVSPDDFSNPEAYIEKYDCKLLENEQDHIKYSCIICHSYLVELGLETKENNCYHGIIIYQTTDRELIEELSFEPDEQEPHTIDHLITKQ
ncbi:hypothetical protein IJ750_06555 [bacterium]|nr:hypothetical protein [Alphaproteobacteria bacterium]MBR1776712.1 hypothetical protein [bacterium]